MLHAKRVKKDKEDFISITDEGAKNMPPSNLLFSFDNQDVAILFFDGMVAIPNMRGVTISILDDVPDPSDPKRALSLLIRLEQWVSCHSNIMTQKDSTSLLEIVKCLRESILAKTKV